LVYHELRKLAAAKLAQEKPGHTLQATALVHEAYIRLVDSDMDRQWRSRGHFFAAAAEAMRRILVENARRKRSLKRGGAMRRTELGADELAEAPAPEELLELDDALNVLAAKKPPLAELVKLRYFAGLTDEEAAEALGVSATTAKRHWTYARAFLRREMERR
jgi:RNA polymerase sigma factor (TIGR02999 family)